MSFALVQFFLAILMVGIAVLLILVYRGYLAADSEYRLQRMLEAAGLDPGIAASAEIPATMDDVRRRCRSCASEDVCERWLTGDEAGSNAFCPNAKVFEKLGKYGKRLQQA